MIEVRTAPLLLLALLAACGGEDGSADGRPTVVVSIAPQAGLVERIAGDHVRVIVLVQPGESPSTYQPTDRQVSDVARASLYFRVGVPFENGKWLGALRSSGARIRIVDGAAGIERRSFGEHEEHDTHEGHEEDEGEEHGGEDPHCWLSPAHLEVLAETIAAALIEIDPDHASEFRRNLERLRADLDRLHETILTTLAPHRGRRIYVFHPAWGYLCDAYALEQVAIEVEGKGPAEAEVTDLMRRAREDGVLAIYVQPQIRSASMAEIARALGVELRTLDPLARDPLANLESVAKTLAEGWR